MIQSCMLMAAACSWPSVSDALLLAAVLQRLHVRMGWVSLLHAITEPQVHGDSLGSSCQDPSHTPACKLSTREPASSHLS